MMRPMMPPFCRLGLGVLCGLATTSVRAELVHVTLYSSEGSASGIISSNEPSDWSPWSPFGPTVLNVFYNPDQEPTETSPDGPSYYSGNPAQNYWTLTIDGGPPPDPVFNITEALTLSPTSDGFNIVYDPDPDDDETFNAFVSFGTAPSFSPTGLPIPPFNGGLGFSGFNMQGDQALFGYPVDGYYGGPFESFSAGFVATPVPEPASYGLAAAVLLAGAVALRRLGAGRRQARA
jgi:hypothetical protein